MAGENFTPHWNKAMAAYPTTGTDIVATLSEEAINDLLAKHHEFDRDRYRIPFSREFPDGDKKRKFTATLDVRKPFKLFLPPQDPAALPEILKGANGWTTLPEPSDRAALRAGTDPKTIGTVMLYCPEFKLDLTWPRFDEGKPDWTWDVPAIQVGAVAYLELDPSSTTWVLRVRMTRIKFSKAAPMLLNGQYEALKKTLTPAQQLVLKSEEDKFNDLLLIALNVASTEYAPRLVSAIDLPTLPVAKSKLQPSMLYMDDRKVTLGSALNVQSLAAGNALEVEQHITAFSARLDLDIENNGGWDALIQKYNARLSGGAEPKAEPQQELANEFPLAMAYVEKLRSNPEVVSYARRGAAAAGPGNVAVGVDEYLLANLVAQSLPKPKDKCENWKEGLGGLVRGRTCSWSSVWGSHVEIKGAVVSGGVNFAFGGKADGCLHVWIPWKCRWEWECASIGISFKGAPTVKVQFSEKQHEGLVFWLDIDASSVDVDVIAPFPLNIVLGFFAKLLVAFALAVVSLVIRLVTFQFVPPLIELKAQKTKLEFSKFAAFPYLRPQPVSDPKKKFIGFECVMAGKQ